MRNFILGVDHYTCSSLILGGLASRCWGFYPRRQTQLLHELSDTSR